MGSSSSGAIAAPWAGAAAGRGDFPALVREDKRFSPAGKGSEENGAIVAALQL